MKRYICFLFLLICLFSCNKNSRLDNKTNVFDNEIGNSQNDENKFTTENDKIEKNEYLMTHYVTDNLKLRESDDLSSSTITTLPKSTLVSIIETGKNDTIDGIVAPWIKVMSQTGFVGWCFSGYVEEIDKTDFIHITNCERVKGYSFPNILNKIGSDTFDPGNKLIIENDYYYNYLIIDILLRNDIPVNKKYTATLKNNDFEFIEELELKKIEYPKTGLLGYHTNVYFEYKPWLVGNDNNWQLIVKANEEELMRKKISASEYISIFYDEINANPFMRNNLRHASLNKEYSYRFKKDAADILVLYYSNDYQVYEPILYLKPNKNEASDYGEIKISWNSEICSGVYTIWQYLQKDFPTKERLYMIFDYIKVGK